MKMTVFPAISATRSAASRVGHEVTVSTRRVLRLQGTEKDRRVKQLGLHLPLRVQP
jgi:hypothetical protein